MIIVGKSILQTITGRNLFPSSLRPSRDVNRGTSVANPVAMDTGPEDRVALVSGPPRSTIDRWSRTGCFRTPSLARLGGWCFVQRRFTWDAWMGDREDPLARHTHLQCAGVLQVDGRGNISSERMFLLRRLAKSDQAVVL